MPAIASSDPVCVEPISPRHTLSALHWIRCNRILWEPDMYANALEPYSRTDLMDDLNKRRRASGWAPQLEPLIVRKKFVLRWHFWLRKCAWSFHEHLESKITPRYLKLFSCAKGLPSKRIWNAGIQCFLENSMVCDLVAEMDRPRDVYCLAKVFVARWSSIWVVHASLQSE